MTRIIPARAGFTLTPTEREVNNPDHPRSRGVYNDPITVGIAQWGSSPLARGLRARLCNHHSFARIIPARAGFTVTPLRPAYCVADHPRSRGVYFGARRLRFGMLGSSPLARGLPFT